MADASPARRPAWLTPPFSVVGVDGSRGSHEALLWALTEARQHRASVEAVMVWSDPWALDGPTTLIGLGREGVTELHERLATVVKSSVAELHAEDVRVAERVIAGHPAEVLARESADAQLLVLGSRGLSGVRGLMLGSVSARCSQLAQVPVVIVPDPGTRELKGVPHHAPGGAHVALREQADPGVPPPTGAPRP